MSDNYQSNLTAPQNVIVKFYGCVNDKNYQEAFDCLTPDFKQRIWQNDLDRFAEGYKYTLSVSQPLTIVDSMDDQNAVVHTYYEDKIEALQHPLLAPLPKATIGQLDMVENNIKEYKKLLLEELSADPKETDDILLRHFFMPNAVETTLWLSKADRSRDEELFTRSEETLQVYRRALCVNTPDGWLINGLRYQ